MERIFIQACQRILAISARILIKHAVHGVFVPRPWMSFSTCQVLRNVSEESRRNFLAGDYKQGAPSMPANQENDTAVQDVKIRPIYGYMSSVVMANTTSHYYKRFLQEFPTWWAYIRQTHKDTYVHTYVHTYIHTYIHTYLYTHVYTYINT